MVPDPWGQYFHHSSSVNNVCNLVPLGYHNNVIIHLAVITGEEAGSIFDETLSLELLTPGPRSRAPEYKPH